MKKRVRHHSGRLCVEALGLEDGERAHPAAQDLGAHARQMQRHADEGEGDAP